MDIIDTPEILFSDFINLFFSALSDNCYHFFSVYRFCYMIVHAGFQAFLHVLLERVIGDLPTKQNPAIGLLA